ncbi:MAG TPA: methylmalonyl-CoA epimerase [Micromonosporaceae bacterium]|jgi:methylmalonyl-CoA/ethylmalonyl-CoA epimerase|nr:methylmalonyl-CoA epimerase [Micromonosporaceae bacterium]
MAAAESVSPSSPGASVSVGAGAGGAASGGAGAGDPVGIIRIDHVGIAVADLDDAIAFYARVFGMTCVHVEENVEQGVREAMLQVGTAPDGGRLQLLAPLTPESTIAKFLDRNGPGIQQLAYTVTDIDATSAALRSRGVRLLYDSPRRGTAGSRVNFVHPKDAGGVLVELVEPGTEEPAERQR